MIVICCASDNPVAEERPVSIAKLKNERWIFEKALSSELTSFVMETLKYVSSINVGFEADSIEAIKRTVKADDGLACVSLSRTTCNGAIWSASGCRRWTSHASIA
jgi:DNA-binding transcriptional LysR family regulator